MEWDLCQTATSFMSARENRNGCSSSRDRNSRPTALEIITYRYRGHSVADPDSPYRTKDEIEKLPAHQGSPHLDPRHPGGRRRAHAELARKSDTAARAEADRRAEFASEPVPGRRGHPQDIYWEEDNPAHKKSRAIVFD